jgi:hypothetical protein
MVVSQGRESMGLGPLTTATFADEDRVDKIFPQRSALGGAPGLRPRDTEIVFGEPRRRRAPATRPVPPTTDTKPSVTPKSAVVPRPLRPFTDRVRRRRSRASALTLALVGVRVHRASGRRARRHPGTRSMRSAGRRSLRTNASPSRKRSTRGPAHRPVVRKTARSGRARSALRSRRRPGRRRSPQHGRGHCEPHRCCARLSGAL